MGAFESLFNLKCEAGLATMQFVFGQLTLFYVVYIETTTSNKCNLGHWRYIVDQATTKKADKKEVGAWGRGLYNCSQLWSSALSPSLLRV